MQRLRRFLRDIALAKQVGLSRRDLKAGVASEIFDERFYLMTSPEIAEAGVSPFEHYLTAGRFEKRKPSAIFDPVAYVEANPEVATSGMEPFLHYVLVAQAAGAPLSKAETILPRPAFTREIAFRDQAPQCVSDTWLRRVGRRDPFDRCQSPPRAGNERLVFFVRQIVNDPNFQLRMRPRDLLQNFILQRMFVRRNDQNGLFLSG